jgi:uncharacterized membrane protein YdjX (TVP38/TMEM64 family)|uniref:TVP38/TMEM64 family membrane protein n=1 Tax=Desulfobacca acetoxidans TaxID=60893 RepID=A0A7V6DPU9_9BACT
MEPLPSPEDKKELVPPPPDRLALLATLLGAGPDMPDWREYLFFLAAAILTLMGTLAYLGYVVTEPFRPALLQALRQPETLRPVVDYLGNWGPFCFVLVQAAQVILMVWPAPLEVASGYLFGMPWGLAYSLAGIVLGSMSAFLLGRWLEKRYVSKRVGPENMRLMRKIMKREGALAGFVIFLIPGFPKDYLCYAFGMTRMPLVFFLAFSTLARLPGTFLFTLQGAEAHAGNYRVAFALLACYVGLAFWLYRNREAAYQWLDRWHPEEDEQLREGIRPEKK